MTREYYVYILTNKARTVLYTGVTSDLKGRVWQHKEKVVEGFTKRYSVDQLVYYETFDDVLMAMNAKSKSRLDLGNGR